MQDPSLNQNISSCERTDEAKSCCVLDCSANQRRGRDGECQCSVKKGEVMNGAEETMNQIPNKSLLNCSKTNKLRFCRHLTANNHGTM